jgi:hypothetical protein
LWSLPVWFMPRGRSALSYHGRSERWTANCERTLLKAAGRGQEFVLDAGQYPEALNWLTELLGSSS